ncbi:response regulator transcription factor [Chamaesiphon sp.]|uniref:response regulator n=1 Tax=Chamaesiphon sp. TaxID=2814140 RepID=UPI0035947379
MIRILLVDDQKSIRERLKSLLETEPDFDVIGMVDNGYDAIEQVKLSIPDVVLMDMEMPDIDGVLATKIISHNSLTTKILVLSSHDSDEYVAESIYAGANGYILKGAPAQEICDAVRFVHRGYMQIAPGLFEKFIPNRSDTRALTWQSPQSRHRLPLDRAEYTGNLELTGINKHTPHTASLATIPLRRSPKSLGWYQAIALLLVGLGLTSSFYLLRQVHTTPPDSTPRQDRSPPPQNI